MAAAADDLMPSTVADSLRADDARTATLDLLEAIPPPIPRKLALSTAQGLVDVVATTEDRETSSRCALLLARLMVEAVPDPTALYSAAFGGERCAAYFAPRLSVEAAQRALGLDEAGEGQPLTREAAFSEACLWAYYGPAMVRGLTVVHSAAGRTATEWFGMWMSIDPFVSKKLMPSDHVPQQLLTLLVELLRSHELPEQATGGAWYRVAACLTGRANLGPVALELGLFDLAVEHLRATGSSADAVKISRSTPGLAHLALYATYEITRCFAGQKVRPDIGSCLSSGLFDITLEMITAFASAGVHGLQDTDHPTLTYALMYLSRCSSHGACERKIRGVASALAFCLEHSLEFVEEMGATTGAVATRVCCAVFGRDEGGSEFTFTAKHIATLTDYWSQLVRAVGFFKSQKVTADSIFAAQLCVSDKNKPLLIDNPRFIPYLVDALLLDSQHPRADMRVELKTWCQQHHVEALAQLAVHDASREALLRDGSVVLALQTVAETGLSEASRELAAAALTALSDKTLVMATEGQKHVMLSYQWDYQAVIQRLNECLIARRYATWFDLTNMKGSTMDAMSDAIEGADVMLYGVSLQYKESANCRLEANYGHQQELDMIPLMMQENYKPQGWLGLLMGTRMWYQMWDLEGVDDAAFERRVDSVVREIGERGREWLPESVPPVRESGPARTLTPPPTHAPTLAPAPAPPAPDPAPSLTSVSLATTATPARDASARAPSSSTTPSLEPQQPVSEPITPSALPSMERQPRAMQQLSSSTSFAVASGASTSIMEVSAFMTEQLRAEMLEQRTHDKAERQEMESKLETQRQRMEAKLETQRKEMETKLETQRHEMEAKLKECAAKLDNQQQEYETKLGAQRQEYEATLEAQRQDAKTCVSDTQIQRLQERLDALHQAKLLTDGEKFALEDKIVDFIECRSSGMVALGQIGAAAESIRKVLGICEAVSKDEMLARQLRRKFL